MYVHVGVSGIVLSPMHSVYKNNLGLFQDLLITPYLIWILSVTCGSPK